MTTTFNISPEFTFYDMATGKSLRLSSPVFHQFLLGLYKDAGIEDSIVEQSVQQDISRATEVENLRSQIRRLAGLAQDLELRLSSSHSMIKRLENTIQNIELRSQPKDSKGLGGYVALGGF